MDTAAVITNYVTLLVALSVSTERLVEIVKNCIPWLSTKYEEPKKEGHRRAALHVLAFCGGIVTAILAKPAVSVVLSDALNNIWGYIALGLLASGGSGFWNGILSYILEVKNIKAGTADAIAADPAEALRHMKVT
ncbi:MAG: hypothetical protein JRE62_14130 [Deltaproteobacteria bacterium]|jgi:hypothetical protein|nr:hypothetical protein [Deltaproteobacteria bacterium]